MLDLEVLTGLPLKMDLESGQLFYDDNVEMEDEYYIPLSDISHVLLNRSIKYPEHIYKLHSNIQHRNHKRNGCKLKYDIIYMPYGLIGIEYIKTHIFYSDFVQDKFDCVVESYKGTLTVLMQKNSMNHDPYDFERHVDEISIVNVEPGQRLAIPSGVYYTFVNTCDNPVVYGRIVSQGHRSIDYSILQRERGLAYYVISKNARIEVVANPKYRVDCDLDEVDCSKKFYEKYGHEQHEIFVNGDEPLYSTFANYPEILSEVIL